MNKNQSTGIIVIVAIILIALLSIAFEGPQTSTSEISYTQFLNKVQMGNIESVVISKDTLIATPKESPEDKKIQENTKETSKQSKTTNPLNINDLQAKKPKNQYRVEIPSNDEDLYDVLKESNVEINIQKPQDGSWMSVLGTVVIPIVFVAIMIILI